MAKEKQPQLNIISIPNGKGHEFMELVNLIRPYAEKYNLVVTQINVVPVKAAQLKKFGENMVKAAEEVEKKVLEDAKIAEIQKKELESEKVSENALDSETVEKIEAEVKTELEKAPPAKLAPKTDTQNKNIGE